MIKRLLLRNLKVTISNRSNCSCLWTLQTTTCFGNHRSFHATISISEKLYVDGENEHAHRVLAQSVKPYQIFRVNKINFEQHGTCRHHRLPSFIVDPSKSKVTLYASVDEAFNNFCHLAEYCICTNTPISDERFERFSHYFCDTAYKLNDSQLLECMRLLACMPPTETVKDRNFMEIWNTLDMVCCQRLEAWDINELLLMCDAWYTLNLARISTFVWDALQRLSRRLLKLNSVQLVQIMFLCNITRRPIYEMFNFEVNLSGCIESMNVEELGVLSMGFFKTKTPIHSPELLEHLYNRLMMNANTVQDITLVAILKVLRYSTKLGQADLMLDLLDKLHHQVDRLSLLSCLHIALLGSSLQCCHDGIIEYVLQRFSRDIHQTRLKDLERISFVLGVFNYRSPKGVDEEICQKILKLLNCRVAEIIKYPRCFSNCLHYLSLRNHYDMEMLSSVLDKRFIHHGYGKNAVNARELFHLDGFVKINLKGKYNEGEDNQLSQKQRGIMGKLLTHYMPERNPKYKLSTTDRILIEIKECTDKLFQHNCFKHILPHYERPDVVFCYDSEARRTLPIAIDCPGDYSGTILTRKEVLGKLAANPHVDVIVIVVAGWNNMVRGKERHTGLFDMKLKQLRLLGHKHIWIYWHEWRDLETPLDRQNYLKRRLASIIPL